MPPSAQWCYSQLTMRIGGWRYKPIFPNPKLGRLAWCVTHFQGVIHHGCVCLEVCHIVARLSTVGYGDSSESAIMQY